MHTVIDIIIKLRVLFFMWRVFSPFSMLIINSVYEQPHLVDRHYPAKRAKRMWPNREQSGSCKWTTHNYSQEGRSGKYLPILSTCCPSTPEN